MNLVDSSGWLAYFLNEKNADEFESVIHNESELIVSVINIHEVYYKVLLNQNEDAAIDAISFMLQSEVKIITSEIAYLAANLRYEKKIPMADSIIYTTAKMFNATLWTQDYDFINLPGVKFIKK